MSRIRQSIVFGCFARSGVSAEQVIREAKRIGYASVEMSPPEHWPIIRDHGLEIATVVGHGTLTDGMNKRGNHDRIADELARNIDTAAEQEVRSLIAFSGNRDGLDDDEGLDICADVLDRVKGHAEEMGLTIVMELLNSKVDHADYQCDSTRWGAELCRRVNSPRVKLLYDIYHMQIMEGDLIRNIGDHGDQIGHYHTAGNPGRNDLDDQQEIFYPAVMSAIAASSYSGFVGHEFSPKGDPIAAMESAFATCDVDA
jgi:hydroxypyruvate isomerase